MNRVTPDDVKEIKETDLSDIAMDVWITAAHTIVDAASSCIGTDEDLLTQIELFLSAHLMEGIDPDAGSRVKRERSDTLEVEYAIKDVSNSIDETVYGKSANMLSRGCLKNLDKASIALITAGHTYAC